jgi:hypothetical protein
VDEDRAMALSGEQWERLNTALVKAFPDQGSLARMLQFRCDQSLENIAAPGPLTQRVFEVITRSEAEGWTARLVAGARESNPGNADLAAAAAAIGLAVAGPVGHALELLITEGQGFLDPMQWRERLAALEGQICHIEYPVRGDEASGTGFLVGPDLVMTNHHVIAPIKAGEADPATVRLRFDYRKPADGMPVGPGVLFELANPDWLVDSSPHSKVDTMKDPGAEVPAADELDYALLRLANPAGDGPLGAKAEPGAAKRGWITELSPGDGVDELVFILQLPDGEPIAMAADRVTAVNANGTRIRYRTNTLSGSSGSPCFDINWRLAALHHSGDPRHGALRKPEYNEGVPIDPVLALLKERQLRDIVFPQPPAEADPNG